jgi:hypothetical protein
MLESQKYGQYKNDENSTQADLILCEKHKEQAVWCRICKWMPMNSQLLTHGPKQCWCMNTPKHRYHSLAENVMMSFSYNVSLAVECDHKRISDYY